MKNKIVALLVCVLFLFGSASADGIKIIGLLGPTSMGMAHMLEQNEQGKTLNKYEFTLAKAPDEVVAKVSKGEVDIAAVPANLASVLYNKTNASIKVVDINTLGVLYIVELGNSIKSIKDLKGKDILASGKGATPEYVLRHLLKQNDIDPDKDVNIEFKSEHSEIVATLKSEMGKIALLPQPFVTVAQSKLKGLNIALDLNEVWNQTNKTRLITGVTIVSKKLYDENPQAVNNFIKDHKASVEYVNKNIDDASKLIEKFDIFKSAIAKKALPYCNIACISGKEMKAAIDAYLNVLYEENKKAIGGKLPSEDFYAIFE